MATADLVTQTLNGVSGLTLETSRFGRSERAVHWLSSTRFLEAARMLKNDAGFDWLENLSAMQVDDSLVFTYFVRSSKSTETAILRASVQLISNKSGFDEDWVEMESVVSVWPMAGTYEAEISRLFGVKMTGIEIAPKNDGFPLRKSFVVNGGIEP